MWVVFILLFLLPLPLFVHAEYLGELSANPARLSGSFGLSGLSGLSGFSGSAGGFAGPVNKTDQIDQIHEIDQFRFSLLI
ncbi:MAG: hypothetical protein HP497_13150 [Nitrospira sp.]|nr:hypothetical protein [Nitrospira sp.]